MNYFNKGKFIIKSGREQIIHKFEHKNSSEVNKPSLYIHPFELLSKGIEEIS